MSRLELIGLLLIVMAVTLVGFDLPIAAAPIALIAVGCFIKGQTN